MMERAVISKARREGLSLVELASLNIKAEVDYSMAEATHRLAVSWGNGQCRRSATMNVADECCYGKEGASVMDELMGNFDLRGELHFLRMYPHFKDRLSQVLVVRDSERAVNRVVVKFKNGQTLEVDERDVNSTEFLAKCVMVNDL